MENSVPPQHVGPNTHHGEAAAYGVGSILAVIASWIVNKSIVWAFVHFFFGWFYVAYACCAHTEELDAVGRATLDAKPALPEKP